MPLPPPTPTSIGADRGLGGISGSPSSPSVVRRAGSVASVRSTASTRSAAVRGAPATGAPPSSRLNSGTASSNAASGAKGSARAPPIVTGSPATGAGPSTPTTPVTPRPAPARSISGRSVTSTTSQRVAGAKPSYSTIAAKAPVPASKPAPAPKPPVKKPPSPVETVAMFPGRKAPAKKVEAPTPAALKASAATLPKATSLGSLLRSKSPPSGPAPPPIKTGPSLTSPARKVSGPFSASADKPSPTTRAPPSRAASVRGGLGSKGSGIPVPSSSSKAPAAPSSAATVPAESVLTPLSSEKVLKKLLDLESERTTLMIANQTLQAEMEKLRSAAEQTRNNASSPTAVVPPPPAPVASDFALSDETAPFDADSMGIMTDSELDQVYQRTMAKMRQAIEQGVGAVKLPLPHISDTASDKMGSEKSEKIKPKDSEEKEKVDAENLPASVETPEAPASIEPIEIAKPEEPKAEADVEKKEGEYVESKDTASAVAETVEIPSAVEVALGDSSAEQIETSVEQISPVAESPRADSDEKVVDAGLVEEEVTETTVHVAVSPSESSKPQTEKVDAVQEEQSVTPTSPVETAEVTDVPSSESAMPAVLPVEQEPEKQSQVEQPEAEGSSVEVTAVGKAPAHALEEKLGSSEQKAADDTQHISPVDSGVGASIEDSVAAAPASGPVPAPTLTPESTEDVPASGAERSSSTETLLTIPSVEPPEVPEPKTVPRPAGSDDGRGTRVRTLWTELDRLSIRSAPVFKRVKFSPPSLADDLDGLNDDVSSIASDERSESSSNLISEAPSDSSYISATNEAELNVVEVRKAALRMMVLLRDLESAAESLASSAKTAPAPPSRSAAPAAASPLATKPPIGLGLLLQDAMSSAGPVSASTSPEAAVLRLAREAYQVAESFGKLCGLEGLSDKKKTRSPGQVSRVSMASRPPPARTHAPSLREMVGRQALMGGPLGPAGTGMGLPYAGMGLRRPGYAASVV